MAGAPSLTATVRVLGLCEWSGRCHLWRISGSAADADPSPCLASPQHARPGPFLWASATRAPVRFPFVRPTTPVLGGGR